MEFKFKNLSEENMDFDRVFENIINFIKKDPMGKYKLMFGTDSQVHARHTLFITAIVIQREGKGAWACVTETIVPRRVTNLHEKISFETSLTEAIVSYFTEEKRNKMVEIVLPHIYKGSNFKIEGHIDIGIENRNKTRKYVNEMVSRVESLGVEPKIKPNSFVASSYANRYTK